MIDAAAYFRRVLATGDSSLACLLPPKNLFLHISCSAFFTSSTLNLWFPDFNSEFLSVLTYLPLSSIFCCLDKFPPVDLVVESGVVPRLVQMLARHDLPQLQLEAAWAITNIACAEVKHARLLIDNGEEIHSQNI